MSPVTSPKTQDGPWAPIVVANGYMTVSVQVGDVKMTVEGPLAQVLAILEKLFGGPPTSASVIAKLQLVFGSETAKK